MVELFFDLETKNILAKYNGKTYHMAIGKEVDYKCKKPLKPFPTPTYSRLIAMPDERWEQVIAGMAFEVNHQDGKLCDFTIDGHRILVTRTLNEVGEPFVKLAGQFPEYFWTGFEKLLNTMLNEDAETNIELEK